MERRLNAVAGSRWRFAAHLGIVDPEMPLLARTARTTAPVDQIICAAALGFAGISDNGLKARAPDEQRRMGAALRDHGLEMGSFTHNMIAAEALFYLGSPIADLEAALSESLAAAERIGGGCINLLLLDSGSPLNDQLAIATENLAGAAEMAGARGIAIAVEVTSRARVPQTLVEKASDVAQLVRATGASNLGLILDSCHCHCSGDAMGAEILRHSDLLKAVQLADMPGRVEPGQGVIDFASIMAALDEIGWTGLVETEFNAVGAGSAGEAHALECLRRLS